MKGEEEDQPEEEEEEKEQEEGSKSSTAEGQESGGPVPRQSWQPGTLSCPVPAASAKAMGPGALLVLLAATSWQGKRPQGPGLRWMWDRVPPLEFCHRALPAPQHRTSGFGKAVGDKEDGVGELGGTSPASSVALFKSSRGFSLQILSRSLRSGALILDSSLAGGWGSESLAHRKLSGHLVPEQILDQWVHFPERDLCSKEFGASDGSDLP